ncbi:hypothetical protein [Nannocystis pusilla]|uniref:hypothetical protein n=1 Tax=Nannocystis pusilla TaxID=889268 RepID=UPI003B7FB8F1
MTKKKPAAPPPKERCFFLASAPDAFEAVKRALEERFEVFDATPDSVSFRWRHGPRSAGPDFRLERSDRAAATRAMRAWQRRSIAEHTPPSSPSWPWPSPISTKSSSRRTG